MKIWKRTRFSRSYFDRTLTHMENIEKHAQMKHTQRKRENVKSMKRFRKRERKEKGKGLYPTGPVESRERKRAKREIFSTSESVNLDARRRKGRRRGRKDSDDGMKCIRHAAQASLGHPCVFLSRLFAVHAALTSIAFGNFSEELFE